MRYAKQISAKNLSLFDSRYRLYDIGKGKLLFIRPYTMGKGLVLERGCKLLGDWLDRPITECDFYIGEDSSGPNREPLFTNHEDLLRYLGYTTSPIVSIKLLVLKYRTG